ncbi:MAG: multi-sensor hybrid histidine kinase [Thermoleophilia bacterium]|nr:multi-sensor hybrid histidine kinase [Thermoleophilia bacterium]
MVFVRWGAMAFAAAQTATFYRPFPDGVLPLAWGIIGAFAVAAAALTAWWLRVRSGPASAGRRLAIVALVTDGALATSLTWIYAFDVETAIFAVLYVAAIEGAFRYGTRGALVTMGVLATLYTARDAWAAAHYGHDFLVVSITFRMGVGFLLATVAGVMADRSAREHRRLGVALEREREAVLALRSLGELRSTFLAAVSHELRTPLTSILGFALTIEQRSAELAPATRTMVEHVVAESRQLEALLGDLLDIERMGRGSVALERRETDVAQLAVDLAARLQARVGRQVLVATQGATGVVDAAKVARIIDNLLANAVKYSPEHTPVEIHLERADGGVLVVVDDEGPGVPEALRTTIFAPFERGQVTSAHKPGTGIGLSLVDRFARLHGGHAWVQDRVGTNGASFRVYLPDGPEGPTFATVAGEPWGAAVAERG